MMPITMMKDGETGVIKKVGGKEETRKFLENLGFVVGGTVTVVSDIGGNLIVNVKDSRVARQGYGMQDYDIISPSMVMLCGCLQTKQHYYWMGKQT